MNDPHSRSALEIRIEKAIRTVPNFPKEGIMFRDITGIFLDPQLSQDIIDYFSSQALPIDAVCGIESRGFIFGFPIALALQVPFILVRKKGKLPPPTQSISYQLEYGEAELEVEENQIQSGQRIMVHDDVLATGGTALATKQLIEKLGGDVVQFSFLVELDDLQGREKLSNDNLLSIVHY